MFLTYKNFYNLNNFSIYLQFIKLTYRKLSSFNMDPLEEAKKVAAVKAVKDHLNLNNATAVGIGSGSTIVYLIEDIASRIQGNSNIAFIPTSFQARQLILHHNLRLGDLDQFPQLDVTFDGADEVDDNLTLIKGGGGCLVQEKIIASCAKKFIVIADYRKKAERLGTFWSKGIPIEVLPMAYVPVKNQLENIGGIAKLRMAVAKAGPLVTDNGNFILDWNFYDCSDWKEMDKRISCIPGVVGTGLFVDMASAAYFGYPDGKFIVKNKPGV